MGFLLEFIMNMVILATKPFSVIRLAWQLFSGAVFLVIVTWMQLVKSAIDLHINVCWNVMIWTFACISLPGRILSALQRERLLELCLNEMEIKLENFIREKKELEERLQVAVKDRKVIEAILTEIDEDHDKAVSRIHVLENQLQDLKDENLRLKEIQAKAFWKYKALKDVTGGKIEHDSEYDIPPVTDYGVPFNRSGMTLEELLMHGDVWDYENKVKSQHAGFLKNGSKLAGQCPFTARMIPRDLVLDEALDRRRGVALSQSVFSAILSLLVGMIVWEAQDPCMPLVVALFIVVGMSLRSVVQFFSTIENRPASDAVALLSFNWFILGTLTSPTLPSVARLLVPLIFWLTDQVVGWFGFSLRNGELVSP